MMAEPAQPKIVKALFNFKGTNNDELCFSKGDVITVTQAVEGGWWEGTLSETTGWFPSNYVKEIKQDNRTGTKSPISSPSDLPMNKRESMMYYHNVVLQSMIDSERTFVTEIQTLLQTYLRPLSTASVLSGKEYTHLCGNLEEITTFHTNLLASLDECAKLPVPQQKTGGLFIKSAPQLKTLYRSYCSNHPTAAAILQHHREELCKYMENKGAPAPGTMLLTTNLSKPFTRLDKYATSLKELERHTEEGHVDRGDTQRAISVYRDIAASCMQVRKQKEVEYEIMNSTIKGWEGQEISSLGEVLMLSHVRVQADNGERKERLMLLFPGLLVMLSVSPRMSGFMFQGKFPVSGVTVNTLEDCDSHTHAFEITGSMIDRRVVSCTSNQEQTQWVELLRQESKHGPTRLTTKPQSLQISTSQPSISTLTQAKTALVTHNAHKGAWTLSCLRPTPPVRPPYAGKEDPTKSPRSLRKTSSLSRRKPTGDCQILEDDAILLKVIEAYCTSAKARHTVNSSLQDSPHVIIAEEEKIIIEEIKGNQTVVEEKTLVDTVYSLKDQMKDLRQDHKRMRKDLEEEKKARRRLENMLRKSLKSLVEPNWEDGQTVASHV